MVPLSYKSQDVVQRVWSRPASADFFTPLQSAPIHGTANGQGGEFYLGVEETRVRQLNVQVIDCYEPEFKTVYYNRESCFG
jgi:hypothetical protein